MKSGVYKLGFSLLIIALLIFGCRKDFKDISPDQANGKIKSFSEMKASPDFNWKTTQNVALTLSAGVRSSLIVKSESGVIFHKALLNGKDTYKVSITIPNYMKELIFEVNGALYIIKIENNRITRSF